MKPKTKTTEPELSTDILWGAEAIAAEIGRPVPVTNRLLRQGLLPADQKGRLWVTTRSRLSVHFNHKSDESRMNAKEQSFRRL